MDRAGQILTGGWMGDSLSVFTRGWWGGVGVIPPTPTPGGGGSAGRSPSTSSGRSDSGRGTYVDWSRPRRRWIDREDEELLIIILDDDGY